MRRELFAYDLPEALIARRPPDIRDGGRLLVLPTEEAPQHAKVQDLPDLLPRGALLVVNDTRVLAARLLGKRAGTGGRAELFLLRRLPGEAHRYRALGRASKPLRVGSELSFDEGLTAIIEARDERGGVVEARLSAPPDASVEALLERIGRVPLPPYIDRADDAADRERYQTVFAKVPGAVAAPTAGLHLSEELLAKLAERGVEIASVTLHVGLGTFQPVTAADFDEHPMHEEVFDVPASTAAAVARARARGAPVVAIGTTVVRALESAADPDRPGLVRELAGETRLLIQPGYRFRVVDRLFTNFHLPESTLLALVCAFGGRERVLEAYAAAIAERYRFYSYGDAMLLTSRAAPEKP